MFPAIVTGEYGPIAFGIPLGKILCTNIVLVSKINKFLANLTVFENSYSVFSLNICLFQNTFSKTLFLFEYSEILIKFS